MPITDPAPATLADTPGDERRARRNERSRRTDELLRAAREATDSHRRELLDEVVVLNREVADSIASRYRNRGVPSDDLRQAAYEGLVKAVHRFDPTVRPDLLTYAVPTIRGEVQRWFRDQGWMVRPPRRIQENQWHVRKSVSRLSQRLGRDPTDEEISADTGVALGDIKDAVAAFGLFIPPSLDGPMGEDSLALLRHDDEDERTALETRLLLAPSIRKLGERDQRILFMRFFEERSQAEIGECFGVTQMQISRVLARIMRELRAELIPESVD